MIRNLGITPHGIFQSCPSARYSRPAVRLGWRVAREHLENAVRHKKLSLGWFPPGFLLPSLATPPGGKLRLGTQCVKPRNMNIGHLSLVRNTEGIQRHRYHGVVAAQASYFYSRLYSEKVVELAESVLISGVRAMQLLSVFEDRVFLRRGELRLLIVA